METFIFKFQNKNKYQGPINQNNTLNETRIPVNQGILVYQNGSLNETSHLINKDTQVK